MRDAAVEADAARLLTVMEAAPGAGVSRDIIISEITRGLLPTVRIAGHRRIWPADPGKTQARAHSGAVVPAGRKDSRHAGKRLRAAGPDAVGQGRPAAADR
jgi:hypothetical protein